LPKPHVCLVTDDGSPITVQLTQALTHQGSKVVVLSFPSSLVPDRLPLPEEVVRVELTDLSEAHLQTQMETLMTSYGSIDTFIHLHPRSSRSQEHDLSAPEIDKAIVRQIFLLAKHLKPTLTATHGDSQNGRNCFLSATWLDGAFGLTRNNDFSAIAGGLFGLTKTLSHEWPSVFCRGIDFSPELKTEAVVDAILAEMHDPNLAIAEVGYSGQGRSTLAC
jgi:NAD(P)-dependent dehydrogenase (short-subunit alcohol dehydrogenase family)